jgi:hypothetical protein
MPERPETEISRLTELLKTVIRISDIPVSEIERRMKQSAGYLSRLFSGAIGLKVRHIFEILEAIELHPSEFFHLVYPRPAEDPSPTAQKMRTLVSTLTAGVGGKPERTAVSEDQLEELLSMLRALLAESGGPRGRAEERPTSGRGGR